MTRSPNSSLNVHVVTHTHWDREWYAQAEVFRLALIDLVDEVLDGAGRPHFLLDGQSIALEDYLGWRPERRRELAAALQEGRLAAGPWYVLGDNLIPGGEALVRNLLHGRAVMASLGATAPPVLYCPDAFGHPSALPILGSGFGCPVAVVWRGFGGDAWPPVDTVRWRAKDGSEVLLYHLPPDGYGFGANLPTEPLASRERWRQMRQELGRRSALGVVLILHGADHHAVQRGHEAALAALAASASPDTVHVSSLGEWARALSAGAAAVALPVVEGELRDSRGYVWSLQGTFGSRANQKRSNAAAERLLVHDVEPWAALAALRTGVSRRHESAALWRLLLASHPHDTLCGCSIDAVASAMDVRLDTLHAAGRRAGERARFELVGHDGARERESLESRKHVIMVRNRVARPRGGVAEIDVDVPLTEVPVGPGSAERLAPARQPPPLSLGNGLPVQWVAARRVFAREESARHYPRNALVERRRGLAWLAPVGGFGLELVPVHEGARRRAAAPSPVAVRDGILDNGSLRVRVSVNDGLSIELRDGRTFRNVIGFESVGERGDLYTHSPIPQSESRATLVSHKTTMRGPLRAELETRWRIVVKERTLTSATGEAIRRAQERMDVVARVQLDAGAEFVRLVISGDNDACDHRLRLRLRTGIATDEVWSDAAFGALRRPPVPHSLVDWNAEHTPRSAPLHRWVARFDVDYGVAIVSDGLAEYEATADGDIGITLLRATGELSRHDLPERPGHAGWPSPTPGAQQPGRFGATCAIAPHGPRNAYSWSAIQRVAEDVLLPLRGESWHSAIDPPRRVPGIELEGEGLAFASCKECEDGSGIVLRCLNLLDATVEGAWHMQGIAEAWLARLDETPSAAIPLTRSGTLPGNADRVRFQAEPHAVVTIVVRGKQAPRTP